MGPGWARGDTVTAVQGQFAHCQALPFSSEGREGPGLQAGRTGVCLPAGLEQGPLHYHGMYDLGKLLNLYLSFLIYKMGIKNFRVVVRFNRIINVKHLDTLLAYGRCLINVIIMINIIRILAEKNKGEGFTEVRLLSREGMGRLFLIHCPGPQRRCESRVRDVTLI